MSLFKNRGYTLESEYQKYKPDRITPERLESPADYLLMFSLRSILNTNNKSAYYLPVRTVKRPFQESYTGLWIVTFSTLNSDMNPDVETHCLELTDDGMLGRTGKIDRYAPTVREGYIKNTGDTVDDDIQFLTTTFNLGENS